MEILDFFNIWVFVRTAQTLLIWLEALELVDQPVPKMPDILYVRKAKAKLLLQKLLFAKNEHMIISLPQFPRFPLNRLTL